MLHGVDVEPSGLFRGCHLEGARRLGALMSIGGLLSIPTFLPFFPPDAVSATLGWSVAALFLLKLALTAAWLLLRPESVTFPRLTAVLAIDLGPLAALQALGGGWAQPYHALVLVPVAAMALILPWRVIAALLPAGLLVVLAPVATDQTAGATQQVVVAMVTWSLATVLVAVMMTRVRAQRLVLAGAARVDPLTALGNRRSLEVEAPRWLREARNAGQHVAVGVADVDAFKALNDTHGHLAGDTALRDLAAAMEQGASPGGRAFRWGGDEFVVLLEAADGLGLVRARESVVRALDGAAFDPDGEDVRVSVGWTVDDGSTSLAGLLGAADAALLERKRGRTRLR